MNYDKVYSVSVDTYVRYRANERSAVTAKTNYTFDKMLKAWAREFARYTSYKTTWNISREQVIKDMAKLSAIYHDVSAVRIKAVDECIVIETVSGHKLLFCGTFSEYLFVSNNIPYDFQWVLPEDILSIQKAYIKSATVFDAGNNELGTVMDFIVLNSVEICTPIVIVEGEGYYEVDYGY